MFDIGFSELLVIAIVALIVLGPERLSGAARFAGLWIRRARTQWNTVKAEFERELEAESIRRDMQNTRTALRETQRQLCQGDAEIRQELSSLRNGISTSVPISTSLPQVMGTEREDRSDCPPPC